MTDKLFYISGMLILPSYALLYLLGGALRPAYSHISNSVSELLSPGAPNRPLLVTIQSFYALFHIGFGYGLLRFVQATDDLTIGRIGAWLIVGIGLATVGTVIFAQDAEGTPTTMSGQIHKSLVFGGLVPLSVFSTLLLGLWTRRAGLFPGFDIYSYVTLAAIVVMGAVGGATIETSFAGLVERIAALVTQQWLFVLGMQLMLR